MNDAASTVPALLRLDTLRVGYAAVGGLHIAVDGVSLTLARGEIGSLLGPSGCGKTTVLRAIAGFEPLQAGRVELDGVVLADARSALPPERRRVGMMFQDYALFPHLDVAGNVGFGVRAPSRAARQARVREALERVGLADHAARYPHELSGGQQQRVALARALAPDPALLLLDEPFSNLDIDTRQRLAGELRALLKAAGTTVLMVTHDQAEAFAMADRIGVMHAGRLLQWDDAETLYRHPVDRFVAGFVGRGALVHGAPLGLGEDVDVLLRPESVVVEAGGPIRAHVVDTAFRGPGFVARARLADDSVIELELPPGCAVRPGDALGLRLIDDDPVGFPR